MSKTNIPEPGMKTFAGKSLPVILVLLLACMTTTTDAASAGERSVLADTSRSYRNFNVAVYARVYEVIQMGDIDWLRERFDVMSRYVKIDRIYLETHRDTVVASEETLRNVRAFFEDRGVHVSGGITLTVNESNRFETFCYSKPEHRDYVKHIVEYTARHFDEIILDDFFFTSCKSDEEIEAKGDRSWTEYRLALMDEAAQKLVLEPARAVNPKVKVVIKYPNWYEHFQGLGFNLETEPGRFDGIYTGTETRDAVRSAQHLQPYHGYQIFRYFENIAPGRNGGGWVDTGGMRYLDRYVEQLWLTLFAKAPEITLFDFRQMQRPITTNERAPWQGQGAGFDFDKTFAGFRQPDGSVTPGTTIPVAVGAAFEQVDRFLDQLGKPIGVACYRPFHAVGEDFLHNFLGMAGIPIDLQPAFPAGARTILLTESAKFDPAIVDRIKGQLRQGKNVVITTGLLKALEDRGIQDVAEIQVTDRKALVEDFVVGWGDVVKAKRPILMPQVHYLTNDSWELVLAVGGPNGWPLLHDADYGKGHLYVLTVPDNFADLYHLPEPVLTRIKQIVAADLFVRLDGPAEVSLFVYDNDTFVVESFRDEAVETSVVLDGRFKTLRNLETDEVLTGEAIPASTGRFRSPDSGKTRFALPLGPHAYRAFRAE